MKHSEDVLNTAKMAVEIGNAILQGKELEYKYGDSWLETKAPAIITFYNQYRVKPTPEFIPFDFSDLSILIGKVIESKVKTFTGLITGIDMNGIYIGARSVSFNQLFNDFKFLDGSPCGKIKE